MCGEKFSQLDNALKHPFNNYIRELNQSLNKLIIKNFRCHDTGSHKNHENLGHLADILERIKGSSIYTKISLMLIAFF